MAHSTTGINIGNGYTKAASESAQIVMPSYFQQIRADDINNYEAMGSGAVIEVVSSTTRSDLDGTRWLLGDTAKDYFPETYSKVVDDLDGKPKYGLPLFLGAMALLGLEGDAVVNAIASIHDAQIHGKNLKAALDGQHAIKINGCKFPRQINLLTRITEEGAGAIASGYYAPNQPVGLIDLGHGTTIASVFRGGKLLDGSRKLIPIGCHQLIEAIANHPQTRMRLRQPGNLHLIREGLQNNFQYGTTG